MPKLKAAFEAAGFSNVQTVLSSGNVLFDARASGEAAIEKRAEAAMKKHLGTPFYCIVRPVEALRALVENDPFRSFRVDKAAKRVVTFSRDEPVPKAKLPIELHGARILGVRGREIFTAYVRHPKGAVFMTLIEKTFGKGVTTRTFDTVRKMAR
jgi:uncharacterized protein (DUF1697 family)